MAKKICRNCGKSFEATGNTVYCCIQCRLEGKKKIRDKWRKDTNYNEKNAERMKASRNKDKAYNDLKITLQRAVKESDQLAKKYSSCIHEEVQTEAQKCLEEAQKAFDAEDLEKCSELIKQAKKHNEDLMPRVEELWAEVQRVADMKARERWNYEHADEQKGLYYTGV